MSSSLKQKTISGIWWSSIERFSVLGVQFLIQIIMARLLTPQDYGLIGMLAIFIAISQSLIDSGFSQALIRKQDRNEADEATVFYFNIAVSLLLYILLCLLAPLVADFYKMPELILIMRILCLGIVINSLSIVQRALLTVKMDFKTQMKASFTASFISGFLGVWMAYCGYGVWALVCQQIICAMLNTWILWLCSDWRPLWVYSWKSFRELFAFSSKLLAVGLIDTLYHNIYYIIIGKKFTAENLGYYTRAQQFSEFPSSNLTGILQRVTYPVLCSIQNDDKRLADIYRRFLKMSAFVIFPIMVGLSSVSEPFILCTLGEQWKFSAVLLQIICFGMMWYPIHAINLNLLQVKGRSDLFLKLEIIKKVFLVFSLIITVPLGLLAMCYGQIAMSLFSLVINTYYTGKLIDVGFFKQMKDLMPVLLLSLSMGGVVYLLIDFISGIYVQLLMGIIVGVFYYFAMSYFFKFSELQEMFSLVRKNKSVY